MLKPEYIIIRVSDDNDIASWPGYRVYRHEIDEAAKALNLGPPQARPSEVAVVRMWANWKQHTTRMNE
jgi:hypothetical protein